MTTGGTATGAATGATAAPDTARLGRALAAAVTRSALHPVDVAGAGLSFAGTIAKLGPTTLGRLLKPRASSGPADEVLDRRFADPAWTENPALYALQAAYVAGCKLGDDVLAAGASTPVADAKAQLAWRMLAGSLAPTNFFLTNPAAMRRAVETGGVSVWSGIGNFMHDVATNGGKPRQVDDSDVELGRTLAATPGTVVFRNDLMELIQYGAQTEQVHAVPLLAVPPWINKYYVMDLAPGRSLLEWAVQHERTVFAISYRNPDASMRDVTMDDYLIRGPLAAMDVVTEITGSPTVDLVGLCIGGAMVAMAAAYLAKQDDDASRVGTVTLLNTLLDYSDAGALAAFTDEPSVARLEKQMARTGLLEGSQMAATFDALRPGDLIFNYLVSNWLLGEEPPAFDILSWNADSTRVPAGLHGTYLRSLYVENRLARGELELAGRVLDLGDVTSPAYVVGAVNDHIVPWTASYQATRLLGGVVRYVLTSGGHIAGVVNPPGPKPWFEAAAESLVSAADWRAAAVREPGSWWHDWTLWGAERAGDLVAPPPTGSAMHPAITDAPGDYVRT